MDQEKKLLIQAIHKILWGTRIGPGMPLLYPEELEAQDLISKYTCIGTPEHDEVFDAEWYENLDLEIEKKIEIMNRRN
jgi:hypothetical protein